MKDLKPRNESEEYMLKAINATVKRPGSNKSAANAWLILRFLNDQDAKNSNGLVTLVDHHLAEKLERTPREIKRAKSILSDLKIIEYKHSVPLAPGAWANFWKVNTLSDLMKETD